ncbi:tyrosine-type recombinase/integrase [Halospina sp. K52047b]|uniref:phage integrase n=1 Tax=Halospina sp. K52047b TaxID=2614160 RepID=UPI00124A672B|nr:tyrosine-type recombinase/integrase [Halospina sp. K52047b]KAA8976909.1 tyrosine-type recombinase/integrase [Halospina sp. K52047b]
MIRKLKNGRWEVDLWTDGRGSKRIRKRFDTKAEAKRFEQYALGRSAERKDWNPAPDRRHLSDLVGEWHDASGYRLKDGVKRKRKLEMITRLLGNPRADRFTASDFASFRQRRIEIDGVTENTVNREQAYLNAVFNELARLGSWDKPNPLRHVRKFKIDEQELAFLTQEEIDRLLVECRASSNPSLYTVTRLALATGARWSEAEGIKRGNLAPYRVTFNYTKSGKSRTVPIPKDLYEAAIQEVPFVSCSAAFRHAIRRAGIELPQGQLTHICRHTYASHFVMNGGDILTLQRILGHSDIKLTMRYAHLSPDHLRSATVYAPTV